MKKITVILFLMLFSIVVQSCSDDEPVNENKHTMGDVNLLYVNIVGSVVDQNAYPVPYARVEVECNERVHKGVTNESGKYSITFRYLRGVNGSDPLVVSCYPTGNYTCEQTMRFNVTSPQYGVMIKADDDAGGVWGTYRATVNFIAESTVVE